MDIAYLNGWKAAVRALAARPYRSDKKYFAAGVITEWLDDPSGVPAWAAGYLDALASTVGA